MDRKLYKLPFQENHSPQWLCPTCEKSVLRIKKDSFFFSKTSLSNSGLGHPAWEPDWVEYIYSCVLECCDNTCKEVVVSVGTGSLDYNRDYYPDEFPEDTYTEYFRPKFFEPHFKIFSLQKSIPDDVVDEINRLNYFSATLLQQRVMSE